MFKSISIYRPHLRAVFRYKKIPPQNELRGISDYYSSVTSGRPAKLLRIDSTPASKDAESTTLQSTEESTADVPMVATAV